MSRRLPVTPALGTLPPSRRRVKGRGVRQVAKRGRRPQNAPVHRAFYVLTLVAALVGDATVSGQSTRLETLPVHGQVSMITNGSTNVVLQAGSQGVLLVDTLSEPDSARLLEAVRSRAGARPIRYIVNTHADADFTGGNENFGKSGAIVVAHENVLTAMSAPAGGRPAAPFAAWPTDTFFQDERTMYFNGEGIQLVHVPRATTDGDVLVFFRSSDVIAAGDIYSTVGYPRIDVARGGHVNGVIEGLNRLIDLAISEQFTEGGTRIVPGRGRVSDEFDVVEYRDMVTIVRDRVQALVAKGQTLEQVKAARPTLDWEPRYGSTAGPWTTAQFVEAVYRSLTIQGGK